MPVRFINTTPSSGPHVFRKQLINGLGRAHIKGAASKVYDEIDMLAAK